MATDKKRRLQELGGSEFEIAKGQPDIRGWEVRDTSGRKIGKVNELIFDSRASKVRYIVVNVLDSKELELEKRTVMIPIGLAVLQPKDDDVILNNVTPFQLRALPLYNRDHLGTKAEKDISIVFGRTDMKGGVTEADVEPEFYNNDLFKEDDMYRTDTEKAANANRYANEKDKTGLSSEARVDEDYRRKENESNITGAGTTGRTDDIQSDELTDRIETDEEYKRRTGKSRRIL